MTQVDSETLAPACTSGDRKITCETLADDPPDHDIPESTSLDYAPESFWLSKDAEFDWFDRNAFLQRKESIKGNSNSINLNPIVTPSHVNANASSLQISAFLNAKTAQKTSYVDSKRRNCKLANILLFPKRSDSIGKEPAVISIREPASPKVSCLGRVRSKSCHRRRKSNTPETGDKKTGKTWKIGFLSCCIQSLFRSGCNSNRKTNESMTKFNDSSERSVPRISELLTQ